jgi:hypothetical protein
MKNNVVSGRLPVQRSQRQRRFFRTTCLVGMMSVGLGFAIIATSAEPSSETYSEDGALGETGQIKYTDWVYTSKPKYCSAVCDDYKDKYDEGMAPMLSHDRLYAVCAASANMKKTPTHRPGFQPDSVIWKKNLCFVGVGKEMTDHSEFYCLCIKKND